MIGRSRRNRGGERKIPFETHHPSVEMFEAALDGGKSVVGHQLIYERVPKTWQCRITGRVGLSLRRENCGPIQESRLEFLE